MRSLTSRIWAVVFLTAAIAPGAGPARASLAPSAASRQVWASHYDGIGHKWDFARAVAVSPDGTTVFSTGKSWGGPGVAPTRGCGCGGPMYYDYATVAYGARAGTRLWTRRYNGPGNDLDDPADIAVGPAGKRVFVTGTSEGRTGLDFATVAYDTSTGRRAWVRRYDGPRGLSDEPSSMAVSPDGSTVYVTGSSVGAYMTIAYSTVTGSMRWLRRYNAPGEHTDRAGDIVVSPDGTTVFVTGYSWNSIYDIDAITTAYDAAAGNLLWEARYSSADNAWDVTGPIDVSPDGATVFVSGITSASGKSAGDDYLTIAYDAATGAERWLSTYQGPVGGGDDIGSLDVSPDGGAVFVTGHSQGASSVDYATVAYDAATGPQLWVTRYDGPEGGNDLARAVSASPDGSTVLVTGYSRGPKTPPDYATVAYDAGTGAQLWMERYDGPAHGRDRATSLVVSPQGTRVFVLGFRESSKGYVDLATVAYAV